MCYLALMQRAMVFGRELVKVEQAWVAGGALAAWWLFSPVTRCVALCFALAVASNDVAWGILWVMNTATVEGISATRWLVRTAHGLLG